MQLSVKDVADNANMIINGYAYTKDGDELNLIEITDEDEFDRVADTFDEMLDDAAFNDL